MILACIPASMAQKDTSHASPSPPIDSPWKDKPYYPPPPPGVLISRPPRLSPNLPGSSRRLFVLQRVSKTFQDTIGKSQLLQQRMYLRPYPTADEAAAPDRRSTLLWLLWNQLRSVNESSITFTCRPTKGFDPTNLDFVFVVDKRDTDETDTAWLHPSASWRKIQLDWDSRVSLDAINVCVAGPRLRCIPRQKEGVRIGQLRDFIQKMIEVIERSEIPQDSARRRGGQPHRDAYRQVERRLQANIKAEARKFSL